MKLPEVNERAAVQHDRIDVAAPIVNAKVVTSAINRFAGDVDARIEELDLEERKLDDAAARSLIGNRVINFQSDVATRPTLPRNVLKETGWEAYGTEGEDPITGEELDEIPNHMWIEGATKRVHQEAIEDAAKLIRNKKDRAAFIMEQEDKLGISEMQAAKAAAIAKRKWTIEYGLAMANNALEAGNYDGARGILSKTPYDNEADREADLHDVDVAEEEGLYYEIERTENPALMNDAADYLNSKSYGSAGEDSIYNGSGVLSDAERASWASRLRQTASDSDTAMRNSYYHSFMAQIDEAKRRNNRSLLPTYQDIPDWASTGEQDKMRAAIDNWGVVDRSDEEFLHALKQDLRHDPQNFLRKWTDKTGVDPSGQATIMPGLQSQARLRLHANDLQALLGEIDKATNVNYAADKSAIDTLADQHYALVFNELISDDSKDTDMIGRVNAWRRMVDLALEQKKREVSPAGDRELTINEARDAIGALTLQTRMKATVPGSGFFFDDKISLDEVPADALDIVITRMQDVSPDTPVTEENIYNFWRDVMREEY